MRLLLQKTWTAPSEGRVLALSAWCTLALAVYGIGFGIAVRSHAIAFDGLFELIDASMTVLAMATTRLLAREGSKRFQFGYWHLEPLVAAFNGAVLALVCVYAAITAVQSVIAGEGTAIRLGVTALYSGVSCGVSLLLWAYQRWANRRLQSTFIRIDAASFLMSAVVSAALFIGFVAASVASRYGFPDLARQADAWILLMLSLALLPMPIRILYDASQEIFLIAPPALDERVSMAAADAVTRHGFLDYESYVAKTGRMPKVEIHFLVPKGYMVSIDAYDEIRNEMASALHPVVRLDQWLTISFTAERAWT